MKSKVTRNHATQRRPDLIERAVQRSGLTKESFIKVITQTAFEGVSAWTQIDMERLLIAAETYGLNPTNKEIFALAQSYGPLQPVLLVVGVDGWSKVLNGQPQFDGLQFLESNELVNEVPTWIECTIYRKDRSVPTAVKEYFQEVKGQHMAWLTHPRRMLRHKAMTQCARLAFSLTGIYDVDEAKRIQETKSLVTKRPSLKASNIELIKSALCSADLKPDQPH